MQRTDNTVKAKSAGRQVGSSTTINRKKVKRPKRSMDMVTTTDVKKSPKIRRFNGASVQKSVKHVSISEPEAQDTVIPEMEAQDALMYESEMQGLDVSAFGMQEAVMNTPVTTESLMREAEMEESVMQESIVEEPAMEESAVENSVMQDSVEEQVETEEEMSVSPHPLQVTANRRVQARKAATKTAKRLTARELKDQAIQKALASASRVESESETKQKKSSKMPMFRIGVGRVVLALACATVAVFAIVYFVNTNMPDVSLKVAAMQTGINASYPSYVPRDYSISSITSENKKIVLVFKNGHTNQSYTLTEETSSWDSNALLTNYIQPTYNDNYTVVKEQGLTIYVSGSNAAWVNGGVMYKITADNDVLSNKQIRSIATSL